MAIAVGVAKVSGALRCNRWGFGLDGDPSASARVSTEPSLTELIDNIAANAMHDRKRLLKNIKAMKASKS